MSQHLENLDQRTVDGRAETEAYGRRMTAFTDATPWKLIVNFFIQRNGYLILLYLVVWIGDGVASAATSGAQAFWISMAFTAAETAIACWAMVAIVKIVREIG